NQWEELSFDLSSLEDGAVGAVGPYDQIVIFPDFTFDPRPQDNIVYFDNITFCPNVPTGVPGCTDPTADNYNPAATEDDGSCLYAVTIQTDLSCYEGDGTQPFVSGGFNGWCGGCNPMTNIGGNIWEATVLMPAGGNEYKIQLDEWADQENFTPGMPCTVTNGGFTNRFIEISGPTTTIPYCFNTCEIFNSAAGCIDPAADNYDPDATEPDGSCIYLVTFMVDMNLYGGSFGTPEVNGSWNGWCGGCQQLFDNDGDGIYSGQHFVQEGPQEFKFAVDGWADQEFFDPGTSCTVTDPSGAFTNRAIDITGPMTVGPFCWASCEECPVLESPGCTDPAANNFDPSATEDDGSCLYLLTLNVDMNCFDGTDPDIQIGAPTFGTLAVESGNFGWCGSCVQMADDDGDDIWTVVLELPAGPFEYKYAHDVWSGQEQLLDNIGESCVGNTDGFNFANRIVNVPDVLNTMDVYGTCSACIPGEVTGCTDPSAANYEPEATLEDGSCLYEVTFIVNMNEYDGTFGIPEVNGSWNGWCGGCQQLSDPDGDNVWEGTHLVPAGTQEYKFAVDGWSDQEFFDPGTSCTVTDPSGAFTNRVFTVSGVQTEGPYCWEECEDCFDPCEPSLFQSAPTNLDVGFTNLSTVLSWNEVPWSIGCQVQGNVVGSSFFPVYLVQGNAPDGYIVTNNVLTDGATYQWRVRCGCSASPLIATPWSDWDYFTFYNLLSPQEETSLKDATVYPNPNNGEFDLTVKGSADESIQLRIYDLLGNIIQEQVLVMGSDQDSFSINVENDVKGIYFVDLISNSSKITKKIVIE
ncbi:MAG: T9SS type A sorting domain-containing protein, partial [Flavobacteriales bacterium]|nr:T9SS type A sorting domain-containing protein [Flavobacteriales bacterium]